MKLQLKVMRKNAENMRENAAGVLRSEKHKNRKKNICFSVSEKQNPSHPQGELFACTSIFHEKTYMPTRTSISRWIQTPINSQDPAVPSPIYLGWKLTTLQKTTTGSVN